MIRQRKPFVGWLVKLWITSMAKGITVFIAFFRLFL